MMAFRLLLGEFEIVATTGATDGRRPTTQSDAQAFDVIDRNADGERRYVLRAEPFGGAVDFCMAWLAQQAAARKH
ncbi:TPA: hypothetical protein QDB15_006236 [Burkholderia vietnamiensis]|jgi:hypothetical protein|nr:hypothetical protein [Burkholderia vietnamiensis]AOK42499.1 hypothetical protein WL96_15170 [Burkholderia vietnamiensis]KVE15950.1 hypothetical protein WI92_08300 [Burkholderia vietnamiensis]KVR89972.1 hypothetical protein WK28_23250 [Burkholderia vietnamiensis]KVR93247.1 hypothetical protein WK29_07360 [Burkholderia vietnamiensis]KVS13930.1 hypothetical protein WK32_31480 [Burkholderia vietnamiensis]